MNDDYPEHKKLRAVKAESQVIGAFLDELSERGVRLCKPFSDPGSLRDGEFIPLGPIEQILADYFGIDLHKIEDEKRAMLAELRGEADQ